MEQPDKEKKKREFVPDFDVIHLEAYKRPEVKESPTTKWVMNGEKNSFYKELIEAYNVSPTNRTVIKSYAKYIYGRGLVSPQMASKAMQFATIKTILSKYDLRAVCLDFKLFGEAAIECIYQKGKLKKMQHVPKYCILPAKRDKNGDITSYFFCRDFNDTRKYKVEEIPAFGYSEGKNGSVIKIISDYEPGRVYFSDPDYLAGIPYAVLEGEIANYCVNHIKNGLSFGHIINMNNGRPESKKKRDATKKDITDRLTGAQNAGKFVINYNENKETAITVESLEISEAHKQYEFLSGEATQKVLISHSVTSPILFGVKDNAGLGNNAQEMTVAFDELQTNTIGPIQETIADQLNEVFYDAGFTIPMEFSPLRVTDTPAGVKLSKEQEEEHEEIDECIADELIALGQTVDYSKYELIDDIEQKGEPDLLETTLNLTALALELASAYAPSNFPERESEQDTDLFLVRYEYKGSADPQRLFCLKMVQANLLYRKEDIDAAGKKAVNPGFGPYGSDKYDIWLYKGGPNCKHFWQRKIYLRKDNAVISASQAQKLINELEPEERGGARIKPNRYEVAKMPYDLPKHGYL